jgi:ribosomal protein L11 methyltransferase
MSQASVSWFIARLDLDPAQVEEAEEALFDAGAQAVTLLDAEDHPVHEPGPGERLLWPRILAEALFEQRPDPVALAERLSARAVLIEAAGIRVATLADRDWVRAWMDAYQPMRFGRDLWICPSHIDPDPDWPRVIQLDPGLAFGSGTHPTTALCLEWLDGQDLSGRTVIDYGCGSGVLAIAAALQGADRIIAVDHDPQALVATRDNAGRNGVSERIEVMLPDDFQPAAVDLVLANILAGPLIELAPRLSACLGPGASLVLSGVLISQADEVAAAYQDRLRGPEMAQREDWARLVFRREGQSAGGGP